MTYSVLKVPLNPNQPIFPCTIKSRSSLLALAHPGGPGTRAVKWLCGDGGFPVVVRVGRFFLNFFSFVVPEENFWG